MKYVALIRGVGPGDPNMSQAKFREFFESLGFLNVAPVISSGNVVFESSEEDAQKLEKKIEDELPQKLGFSRMTIVRSEDALRKFVARDPFKGAVDEKPNYLLVTFFKDNRQELPTLINLQSDKTPDFMAKAEKEYGKNITSRTWKTVNRILKVMEK